MVRAAEEGLLPSPATPAASRWSAGVSTLDSGGCGRICLSPGCPELAAGELEAEDLAGAGVSTSAGTGSDVEDQAFAGRLARLTLALRGRGGRARADARAGAADLALLRGQLLELGRLADGTAALAALAGIEPELPGLFIADEL